MALSVSRGDVVLNEAGPIGENGKALPTRNELMAADVAVFEEALASGRDGGITQTRDALWWVWR